MRRIVTSIKGRSRTFYVNPYEVRKNGWGIGSVVSRVRMCDHTDGTVYRYLSNLSDADYEFGDSRCRKLIDCTLYHEGFFEIDAIEGVEYKGEGYDKIHLKPKARNRG